jgi:hypothetical protein
MDGIVMNLAFISRRGSEVWKLGENTVYWCTATDDFDAGDPVIGRLAASQVQTTM